MKLLSAMVLSCVGLAVQTAPTEAASVCDPDGLQASGSIHRICMPSSGYLGDARFTFEYFFPGLIPGDLLRSDPGLVAMWDEYSEHTVRPLVFSPDRRPQLEQSVRVAQLRDGVVPINDAVETLGGLQIDRHGHGNFTVEDAVFAFAVTLFYDGLIDLVSGTAAVMTPAQLTSFEARARSIGLRTNRAGASLAVRLTEQGLADSLLSSRRAQPPMLPGPGDPCQASARR